MKCFSHVIMGCLVTHFLSSFCFDILRVNISTKDRRRAERIAHTSTPTTASNTRVRRVLIFFVLIIFTSLSAGYCWMMKLLVVCCLLFCLLIVCRKCDDHRCRSDLPALMMMIMRRMSV